MAPVFQTHIMVSKHLIPLSLYLFEIPIELNLNYFAVPPEQLYATQLSQLQEMGFFDTQENIRALSSTSGNVNAAIERLLGGSVDR